MWINGVTTMAGAVLATSSLIVANEGIGGEYLPYTVAAIGGTAMVMSILGFWCARAHTAVDTHAVRWGYS
jgi:hypothetical protein|eukprot:COSAG01_NODE_424_length_17253_cov_31.601900_14_plen_70_part_00